MKQVKKSLVFGIVAAFGFVGYAISEEPTTEAKMELQQIALFKNGLGFFVSEVTIPEKVRSFYIVPDAAASHGTFWVSYPPKVKVKDLVAKEIEIDRQIEAITIPELLRANVGKAVRLHLMGEKETIIEGKIKDVAVPPVKEIPSPYSPGRVLSDEERGYYRGANLMLIETDEGQIAIDPARIEQVFFQDEKPSRTFGRKTKSVRLNVELGASAGKEKLTLSCLAKGVTWAPSYMVDITESDKARLAAKAEVINEVCDLNKVDVQLVTGYPNLQFAGCDEGKPGPVFTVTYERPKRAGKGGCDVQRNVPEYCRCV